MDKEQKDINIKKCRYCICDDYPDILVPFLIKLYNLKFGVGWEKEFANTKNNDNKTNGNNHQEKSFFPKHLDEFDPSQMLNVLVYLNKNDTQKNKVYNNENNPLWSEIADRKMYVDKFSNAVKYRNLFCHQSPKNVNKGKITYFEDIYSTLLSILRPFKDVEELKSENGMSYHDILVEKYSNKNEYVKTPISEILTKLKKYSADITKDEVINIFKENGFEFDNNENVILKDKDLQKYLDLMDSYKEKNNDYNKISIPEICTQLEKCYVNLTAKDITKIFEDNGFSIDNNEQIVVKDLQKYTNLFEEIKREYAVKVKEYPITYVHDELKKTTVNLTKDDLVKIFKDNNYEIKDERLLLVKDSESFNTLLRNIRSEYAPKYTKISIAEICDKLKKASVNLPEEKVIAKYKENGFEIDVNKNILMKESGEYTSVLNSIIAENTPKYMKMPISNVYKELEKESLHLSNDYVTIFLTNHSVDTKTKEVNFKVENGEIIYKNQLDIEWLIAILKKTHIPFDRIRKDLGLNIGQAPDDVIRQLCAENPKCTKLCEKTTAVFSDVGSYQEFLSETAKKLKKNKKNNKYKKKNYKILGIVALFVCVAVVFVRVIFNDKDDVLNIPKDGEITFNIVDPKYDGDYLYLNLVVLNGNDEKKTIDITQCVITAKDSDGDVVFETQLDAENEVWVIPRDKGIIKKKISLDDESIIAFEQYGTRDLFFEIDVNYVVGDENV